MKNLNKYFEGLLSSDFDIAVGPIELTKKIHNSDLERILMKDLCNINSFLCGYSPYKNAIETLRELMKKLNDVKYTNEYIESMKEEIGSLIKVGDRDSQTNKRNYQSALRMANFYRPIVPIAEEVDEVVYNFQSPKDLIIKTADYRDNDPYDIIIYALRKTQPWMQEHAAELAEQIRKIGGVQTVELDGVDGKLEKIDSILITVKR